MNRRYRTLEELQKSWEVWEERWAGGPNPVRRQSPLRRMAQKVEDLLLSPEDELLRDMKWRFNRWGYLFTSIHSKGERHDYMIHRVVMYRSLGRVLLSHELVDHKWSNRLDNRRDSLRLADFSESRHNCRNRMGRGAQRVKGGWMAKMMVRGERINLGVYPTRTEAAKRAEEERFKLGLVPYIIHAPPEMPIV